MAVATSGLEWLDEHFSVAPESLAGKKGNKSDPRGPKGTAFRSAGSIYSPRVNFDPASVFIL